MIRGHTKRDKPEARAPLFSLGTSLQIPLFLEERWSQREDSVLD